MTGMSTDNTPNDPPEPSGKGKGRSQSPAVTERTPLLGSQSHNGPSEDPENSTRHTGRTSLWSKLSFVFFVSLGVCIFVFAILALIAYEYAARASNLSTNDLLSQVLVTRGPDRVDVLNVTDDGGIWVNVTGRIGIDAGSAVDLARDKGHWPDVLTSLARWAIRRLDRVSVNLSTIDVLSRHDKRLLLASLHLPLLELPVTVDPPFDCLSWLTNMSLPLFIRPTNNSAVLVQFVRDAWRHGVISVDATTPQVVVRGGGLHETGSWRKNLKVTRSNIQTAIHIPIPSIPGFPTPGRDAPFPDVSELITVQSFGVSSTPNNISLFARATIIDPAPLTFNLTSPSFPFIVSFPTSPAPNTSFEKKSTIPVASISTAPFTLTHPNITLLLSGVVLPLPAIASPLLSAFVTNYMSGISNPIVVSTPLLPEHFIDFVFPAPHPKPQILRNVTIHDLKVKPSAGGPFLASGTVFVRVVLPKGMNIGLDVNRVLPDVLVFDGEVPMSTVNSPPGERGAETPPLPDPVPDHAFAHIKPNDWLDALSEPDDDDAEEEEGSAYAVCAKFVDVPLEVLPGRQKEFSDFVRKAIFGTDGTIAGILGSAAVAADIQGLPLCDGTGKSAEIEFDGLPFRGKVRVGKKLLEAGS